MKVTNKKSGFTLVEILIVVIILGILAAVVVPQFMDASTDAKNSSLDSNIQILQSQCELYKAQHLDNYPWDDGAGGLAAAADIITLLTTKTDQDGVAGGNLGPYMSVVPCNPYLSNATAVFAIAAADGVDWVVDLNTGAISDGRP